MLYVLYHTHTKKTVVLENQVRRVHLRQHCCITFMTQDVEVLVSVYDVGHRRESEVI